MRRPLFAVPPRQAETPSSDASRLSGMRQAVDPGGMARAPAPAPLWNALLGLLVVAVFTLDLYAPLSVTSAVLYPLLVILTAVWSGQARIVVATVVTLALTLVGWAYARYELSPDPAFNRLYSLLAILVAGWISLRLERSRQALRDSLALLARELEERGKMERWVHESERRYRYLFRNASDVFLVVDAFTHEIVDFNRKAVEFYGYSEEDLVGLRLEHLVAPACREQQAAMLEVARAEGAAGPGELAHQSKGGAPLPVQPQLTALQLGDRRLIFLIVRDLSTPRLAQSLPHAK